MIVRDWQRLVFNLLLGPPISYLVGLGAGGGDGGVGPLAR